MQRRLILFGAFDRHNFGDLLLAHCAAAKHPGRDAVFAGLVARDMRPWGGHVLRSLRDVIAEFGDDPADLVHVGGEILTTTAWEAAVMLQTRAEARRVIKRFDRDPAGGRAWAAEVLGTGRELPYVSGADDLPRGWIGHFVAAGGVAFERLPSPAKAEALIALRRAASLSVRDRVTQAALKRHGLSATLAPDPAAEACALFGTELAARAARGELADLRSRMPRWLAVQLAAEWGDDATLVEVARAAVAEAQLRQAGIVLFCAGLAPWHDDPEVLQRLATHLARLRTDVQVVIFRSGHVFDLCALLAGACGYLGTSLHGWIVARAFGVSACCLVHDAAAKAASYIDTWRLTPEPGWTAFDALPRAARKPAG